MAQPTNEHHNHHLWRTISVITVILAVILIAYYLQIARGGTDTQSPASRASATPVVAMTPEPTPTPVSADVSAQEVAEEVKDLNIDELKDSVAEISTVVSSFKKK